MVRERKKTWKQKVDLVQGSYRRASSDAEDLFAKLFYENLFFLNPKIKNHFKHTDFEHQEKALIHALTFLFGFFEAQNETAKIQIQRIAKSHSHAGLSIHPHYYYFWIEALIMTARTLDKNWYKDLEYYFREVINFPVSYIISQYYFKEE
jgi:hemoglobin-like flavoprotein